MNLACTMAPGRGDTDLVLFGLVEELEARGIKCCGTVQVNSERADGPCDMDVKVLPAGPVVRISQDLGSASRGCRLDPAALEEAVGLVGTSLRQGADFLVINKFGKHEAEGRGFRAVIAEALERGIPVLVGLNSLNKPAFDEFAGGFAVELQPEGPALTAWALSALSVAAG